MRRPLVITVGLLAVASLFCLPPRALIWAPLAVVRGRLLCATHRGAPKAEVLSYLAAHGYHVTESSDGRKSVPGYPVAQPHSSYVAARVGGYRVPFRTDVVAFYLFDQRGCLRDIVTRRYIDAL
jgi:hypothetical protein